MGSSISCGVDLFDFPSFGPGRSVEVDLVLFFVDVGLSGDRACPWPNPVRKVDESFSLAFELA